MPGNFSIEQNIVDAVEISKHTNIPILFMSNPGLGKTTILNRYADKYDYHLETLIGSRFTPEEISGYQVNTGDDHLHHLNPEWFSRIHKQHENGRRTLLFIDELSTCSEFVQGSLLSLIFDRTIGNGKFLPEDCIIVSAANYSGNLPSSMTMMAPTLNRFIIVNLNDNYNAMDLMAEFLNPAKRPVYPSAGSPMTEKAKSSFMENYQKIWKEIFIKYSDPRSTLGLLDISNRNLDGLYSESKGSVYNFISGRTLSYLARLLIAFIELKINNSDVLCKMINGLVGAGTCLFKNELQANEYRKVVFFLLQSLVANENAKKENYIPLVKDIAKDVASYMTNRQNVSFDTASSAIQLSQIKDIFMEKYSLINFEVQVSSKPGQAKFVADFNSIIELLNYLMKMKENTTDTFTEIFFKAMDLYAYYCDIINVKPDYKSMFGVYNSNAVRIVLLKEKNRGKAIYRGIIYRTASGPKTFIMKENENYMNFDCTSSRAVLMSDAEVMLIRNNIKYYA